MVKFMCLLIFSATFISCNQSNSNNPYTPPPSVPDVPSEPDSSLWTQLKVHFVMDVRIPETCEFPWALTIKNDGSFNGGPCHGQRITGNLTAQEKSELRNRADKVAENINAPQVCDETAPITQEHHDMTLANRRTQRFFERNLETQKVCYKGGKENAQSLQDYLVNTLLTKYYRPRSQ
jgi:hypothetical protein